MSADTGGANINTSVETIAQISKQGHIIYLLCAFPRNDKRKVVCGLIQEENAKIITTSGKSVTMVVIKPAVIMGGKGCTPDALLLAKKGGEESKNLKKDKRKNDRKEKYL